MIIGAIAIYFTVTMLFFNFSTLSTVSFIFKMLHYFIWQYSLFYYILCLQTLTVFSAIVYIGSYQFMKYIAHATYSESGQLLDSGIDLNIEGGIAE